MSTSPIFTAGGLASGLDTNKMIDQLVALESRPITTNSQRQAALNVQISAIGNLLSKIKSMSTTATALGKGVSSNTVTNTPAGISVVTGTGAMPGRYSISVTGVASTAKGRSSPFLSANDTVAGGAINLHVQGVAASITITPNSDLGSVVQQINQANKGITAAVISDGTNLYVSLSNTQTGKPIGSAVDGGLTIDSDATGLGLHVTHDATNAVVNIDDLRVESKSNDISTAIPGLTISVKAQQLVASELIVSPDAGKSTSNLQGFVDAYNGIMTSLQQSLRPNPESPPAPGTTLDGSLVLGLQRRMHGLLSSQVVANASVRTLADIGLKLQNDGTLKIDTVTLNKALANDPGAVDAIFSTATTGMAAKVNDLSTTFTDPVNGQLIQRQGSLTKTIKDITATNAKLQTRVNAFKVTLQRQFTTMESLISKFNTIGTFLTNSPPGIFNNGSSK